MYTLYDGGKFTRTMIVKMLMVEGNIPYTVRDVDIFKNEHRSPEFLAINPAGFVPVLQKPDGEVIYETPAINLYLADQHQLTELAPAIDEPDRAQFLSGLFFLSDDLEPIMKRYFYPHRYVLRDSDTAEMKERSLEQALDRLAVIEKRLQDGGPYFLGRRFSLLDIILSYWLETINNSETLSPVPAVLRCLELVANRPKLREFFDTLTQCRIDYGTVAK